MGRIIKHDHFYQEKREIVIESDSPMPEYSFPTAVYVCVGISGLSLAPQTVALNAFRHPTLGAIPSPRPLTDHFVSGTAVCVRANDTAEAGRSIRALEATGMGVGLFQGCQFDLLSCASDASVSAISYVNGEFAEVA